MAGILQSELRAGIALPLPAAQGLPSPGPAGITKQKNDDRHDESRAGLSLSNEFKVFEEGTREKGRSFPYLAIWKTNLHHEHKTLQRTTRQ